MRIVLLLAACIPYFTASAQPVGNAQLLISSGQGHTVALKTNGTVWAWGNNAYGQLGINSTVSQTVPVQVNALTNVLAIAAGQNHALAVSNGYVWAWGYNGYGQIGINSSGNNQLVPVKVNGLANATAVAAGFNHSLAVSNGYVWAWGVNSYGQLGDNSQTSRLTPVPVPGVSNIIAVIAGENHSVALRADGTVWAWGYNGYGQLGDTTTTMRTTAVPVNGLSAVVQIGVGQNHTIALRSDGTVWAWGYNANGQLGDGTATQRNSPVKVIGLTGVTNIAGGNSHVLAFKSDGSVWAWAYGGYGELGGGDTPGNQLAPKEVVGLSRDNFSVTPGVTGVAGVGAGWNSSFVWKLDGTVWVWGRNDNNQLGDGTTISRVIPIKLEGFRLWTLSNAPVFQVAMSDFRNTGMVVGGGDHTLALKDDGRVWSWGYNAYGQLGNGNTAVQYTPGTVSTGGRIGPNLIGVVMVAAGSSHSLALCSDGTVWAWGYNGNGQLGDSTTTSRSVPVQVLGLSGVAMIAAGEQHSFALKADGTVWAWGYNGYGQLGDGTTANKLTPVQVNGVTAVKFITAGDHHGLMIKADGTVWGIGRNNLYGIQFQTLGEGTATMDRSLPVMASGVANAVAVSAGSLFSVVRLGDGRIMAFGDDSEDQTINFTPENTWGYCPLGHMQRFPEVIGSLSDATQLTSSSQQSFIVNKDGNIFGWGYDADGQLGDGGGVAYSCSSGSYSYYRAFGRGVKSITGNLRIRVPANLQGSGISFMGSGRNQGFAVQSNGVVWAWGVNNYGQLGIGTTDNQKTPIIISQFSLKTASTPDNSYSVSVAPAATNGMVCGGDVHTLALKTNGTVWAVGYNGYGQLGIGSTVNQTTPQQVNGLANVSRLAAGFYHSLAVSNGTVWAWGYNGYGQLGINSTVNQSTPTKVSGLANISNLAAGFNHSLAVSNGYVWGWGRNDNSQLGDNTSTSPRLTPVLAQGISSVVAIAAGESFSTALKSDGTVWTWGDNTYAQLGDTTTTARPTAVQVNGLGGVIQISAGQYHTLALRYDGTVWAWGYNGYGQLGDGTTAQRNSPVQVLGLTGVTNVTAGYLHSMAFKSDGTAWAWGNNGYGQLGVGDTLTQLVPKEIIGLTRDNLGTVPGITGVIGSGAGGNSSFVWKQDGTIWSWGRNDYSQLGDTTTIQRNAAVKLEGIQLDSINNITFSVLKTPNMPAIASGADFSLGLRSDGVILSWGAGNNGRLGNGATTTVIDPKATLVTNAINLAAGWYHGLAVRNDRTVVAWGYNNYYQLGNASGDSSTPVVVSGIGSVDMVAAAESASLALKSDGTVWGWGRHDLGQLGNGSTTPSAQASPVQAQNVSNITMIAAGRYHSLAVQSNGNVWAWGYGASYQLGTGAATNCPAPIKLGWASNAIAVAAGESHSLILASNRTVLAFGNNYFGQLGDGSTTDRPGGVVVNGLTDVVAISAGQNMSMALKADGTVWAWGQNGTIYGGYGLGDGATVQRPVPVRVAGLTNIIWISIGVNHAMAGDKKGVVWAWGYNGYGQLGNTTTTSPQPYPGLVTQLRLLLDFKGGYQEGNQATEPNIYAANPAARSGKFSRGGGDDPAFISYVAALDYQKGIQLDQNSTNVATYYPGNPWATSFQHYNATNVASPISFTNPIAGFGMRAGGSPLYLNNTYRFDTHFGIRGTNFTPPVLCINVYNKSDFALVASVAIQIPAEYDRTNYARFIREGTNVFAYGLNTFIRPNDNSLKTVFTNYSYYSYLISHTSTNASYFYEICGAGAVETLGAPLPINRKPMVTLSGQPDQLAAEKLYILDFDPQPSWHVNFVDQPQFQRQPLPPDYLGKTALELQQLNISLPTISLANPSNYLQLNQSPELRRHAILDGFVADLHNDPIALARYVINEIGNTDLMPGGDVAKIGGLNRSALAVFQEGQGSPLEQCALLVYLLRQAQVPACYVFSTNQGLTMLDSNLEKFLGFHITTNEPTAIPVAYPWVAAWVKDEIAPAGRWVQIFPWLKDEEVVEGLDFYRFMPEAYNSGYKWMTKFMENDTNIMSLSAESDQPAVLLPKFIDKYLLLNAPGLSLDDMGLSRRRRSNVYHRWNDFPKPFAVGSDLVFLESLTESPNIFNTVRVDFDSPSYPYPSVTTGEFLMVDLHNREVALVTDNSETSVQIEAYQAENEVTNALPNVNAFSSEAGNNFYAKISPTPPDLSLKVVYRKARPVLMRGSPLSWSSLGNMSFETINSPATYPSGGAYALCFNYNRVTKRMLDTHARKIWKYENSIAQGGKTNNVIALGSTMSLLGMSYYEYISQFDELNQRLHKIHPISLGGHTVTMLMPTLVNGETKVQAKIDSYYNYFEYFGGEASAGKLGTFNGYAMLAIAQNSAAEHGVVKSYLRQTNASSTFNLLQKAGATNIVRITKDNYLLCATNFYNGKTLQAHDAGLWKAVSNNFNAGLPNDQDKLAFLTPGTVTNDLFVGMGGLIIGNNEYQALITGLIHGGFSSPFPRNSFGASSLSPRLLNFSLRQDSVGRYWTDFGTPQTLQYLAPARVSWNSSWSYYGGISQGNYTLDRVSTQFYRQANTLFGDWSGGYANSYRNFSDRGILSSSSSFFGDFTRFVADPVNVMAGEFYVDSTDLKLAGPMPLEIRRNYSSHNLAWNQFGYGWKFNYMPYLSVSSNNVTIYAAEADGSVIAYIQTNSTLWLPTLVENPHLNNLTYTDPGRVGNVLLSRLEKYSDSSSTNYILRSPDGSWRQFEVRAYPVVGTNGVFVDRARPYLKTWTDNRSNYLKFVYESESNSPSYGQVKQIVSSSGNYAGFVYDTYGHVTEAYVGDGRRLYYDYDSYGDLTKVRLPDNAEFQFEYLHDFYPTNYLATNNYVVTTNVVTNTFSTHLLIREVKPDGRILVNEYDEQRRVTNQWSTVGSDLKLVRNASFVYSNNFNYSALTNVSGQTNTISGYTTIKDAYNQVTRYDYTNGLISKVTDPLNQSETQEWFSPGDGSPGAYPRSLKRSVDKRGLITTYLYNTNGYATNVTVTGNLLGDGNTSTAAVTGYTYLTNTALQSVRDPVGNRSEYYYTNALYPYLPTSVANFASNNTVLGSNLFFYAAITNVEYGETNIARGVLERLIAAANTEDATTNEWTYSARGFVLQQRQPTGTSDPAVTNKFLYNNRGEVMQQTDADNRSKAFDYDGMGRLKWTEVFTETGQRLAGEYNYYNENGELAWTDGPRSGPEDYVWFDYDGAGRKTVELRWRSQAKGDGSGVEAPVGDELFATMRFEYDAVNNMTAQIDPLGRITRMDYDAIGRKLAERFCDTNGITGLATNRFGYEPGGAVAAQTNALGGYTLTTYTSTGQPQSRRNLDGTTNEWRYTLDGRIQQEMLPNGSRWGFVYDYANRRVSKYFTNAAGVTLTATTQYLDRRGNVVTNIDEESYTSATVYDDLNRVKSTIGPAGTASSVQQIATHFYDGSGKTKIVSNVLGEVVVSISDAMGREVTNQVRSAANALITQTATSYSNNHHSVTVVAGVGAGSITNRTFTDNFGKTVLSQRFPTAGSMTFNLNRYDTAGNLVSAKDELGQTTTSEYDSLNRLRKQTLPDNAVITFGYDALGAMTNRTMPGGLIWSGVYDSIGRKQSEQLSGGALANRQFTYQYFTTGPNRGLLFSTLDQGRSVTVTNDYDEWQRVKTTAMIGSLPDQNVRLDLSFDRKGQTTNWLQVTGPTGSQTTNQVGQVLDGYGQTTRELVRINGVLQSDFSQTWDAAGRRRTLVQNGAGLGGSIGYGRRADGSLTQVSQGGKTFNYGYGNNGLLTGRTNDWRSLTVNSRDGVGRILQLTTATGAGNALVENLTWQANSKLASYSATRSGTGAWNDNRNYAYNSRNQLTNEPVGISTGVLATNNYAFDANKLGVLTKAQLSGGLTNGWQAIGLNSLAQITGESWNRGSLKLRSAGLAFGAQSVTATLDGGGVTANYSGLGTEGRWWSDVNLNSGLHTLVATAHHPSGLFHPSATNTFTVAPTNYITDAYDGVGNVTNRIFTNGKSQVLVWDGLNRLVRLVQRENPTNGFNWIAVYDALGRRMRTTQTLVVNGVTNSAETLTLDSYFDVEVEFQELAVAVNGARTWKVLGLDVDEDYGGMQGVGGLEATIRESDGTITPVLNDYAGNVLATVASGVANWSPVRVSGYGPVNGYQAATLSPSVPLSETLVWRTRRVDPSGFFYLGARYYDGTSGRFLSPDPLGHSASMDLYSFADGDPLNNFDADGRFVSGMRGGASDGSVSANASRAYMAGYFFGGVSTAFGQGWGEGSAIVSDTLTLGKVQSLHAYTSTLQGGAYDASRTLSKVGVVSLALASGGMAFEALPAATQVAMTQLAFNPTVQVLGGGALAGGLSAWDQGAGPGGIAFGAVQGSFISYLHNPVPLSIRQPIYTPPHDPIIDARSPLVANAKPAAPTINARLTPFTKCFPAGTLVMMADGSAKPIEEIREGEKVWTDDPCDAEPAASHSVAQLHHNWTRRLIRILVDEDHNGFADGAIQATGDHPFWTTNRGWIAAKDLKIGDVLQGAMNLSPIVVSAESFAITTDTFNLTVDGTHTFFVFAGKVAVLVHNTEPFDVKPFGAFDSPQVFANGTRFQRHEMLQDAWLRHNLSADVYARFKPLNPSLALDTSFHQSTVNAFQRNAGLWNPSTITGQSAYDNIRMNIKVLENAGVSRDVIARQAWDAKAFASSLPCP